MLYDLSNALARAHGLGLVLQRHLDGVVVATAIGFANGGGITVARDLCRDEPGTLNLA